MGTCISKCCLNPSSNLPQDKLVISQSPLPPQPPPPQLLFVTSSSSPTTSTPLSSSSSTSTATGASYPSSSSISKPRPYTNDFLLACAKQHPRIIILDPHKYDAPKPKQSNAGPPVRPKLVKLPSKRERSSSPQRPLARQKRFMSSQTKPGRALSSTDNVLKDRPRCCGRKEKVLKDRPRCCGRKEKVRPSSDCRASNRLNFTQSRRDAPVEDMDNPLISMECFIFL